MTAPATLTLEMLQSTLGYGFAGQIVVAPNNDVTQALIARGAAIISTDPPDFDPLYPPAYVNQAMLDAVAAFVGLADDFGGDLSYLKRSNLQAAFEPASGAKVNVADYATGPLGAVADPQDPAADDSDALDAAIAAAVATGRRVVQLPVTPYGLGISRRIVFPVGVYPVGDVAVKRNPGANPGVLFRCLTPGAGVDIGGFNVKGSVQGGVWGGFAVDGGNTAVQPLRLGQMSQTWMAPVQVRNAAVTGAPNGANDPTGGGDPMNDMAWNRANASVLIDYLQNSELWLNVANGAGNGVVFDRGCGGNTVHLESADYGGTGGWALVFQQSEDPALPASISPYPVPQNNALFGWGGLERGGPNAYGLLNHLAGAKNSIDNMFLADGKVGISARPVVRMRNIGVGVSNPLHLGKLIVNGAKNIGTALDIGDQCEVVLTDYSQLRGFQYGMRLAAGARVRGLTGQSWNVDALYDPAGVGDPRECVRNPSDGALFVTRQSPSAPVIRANVALQQALVATTAGSTTITSADGTAVFGPANRNTPVRIAAAGDVSPIVGAPRADFTAVIQTVAADGKSATLSAAPAATLASAWASYRERWHRGQWETDFTLRVGDGTVTPPVAVAAWQWPGLGSLLTPPAIKTAADETQQVTDTTVVGDNRLSQTLAPNATHIVETTALWDGPAVDDVTFGWLFPAGATGVWTATGPAVGAAAGAAATSVVSTTARGWGQTATLGTVDPGNQQPVTIRGVIVTGSTGGPLQLRWGKGATSPTSGALTLKAFSTLSVRQVPTAAAASSLQTINVTGDSLAKAHDLAQVGLADVIPGVPVNNSAVTSSASTDAAVRTGGVTAFFTVPGGQIPAGTGTTPLTFDHTSNGATTFKGTSGTATQSFRGRLAGVDVDVVHAASGWSFTRRVAGTAVPLSSSTPVPLTDVSAGWRNTDAPSPCGTQFAAAVTFFGFGRNNVPTGLMSDIPLDLDAAVASLHAADRKFIVGAVYHAIDPTAEPPGSAKYQAVDAENARRLQVYGAVEDGGVFWDDQRYLRSYALAALGKTATSQDNADIANGYIPTSLHVGSAAFTPAEGGGNGTTDLDNLHLVDPAYRLKFQWLGQIMKTSGLTIAGTLMVPGKGWYAG